VVMKNRMKRLLGVLMLVVVFLYPVVWLATSLGIGFTIILMSIFFLVVAWIAVAIYLLA
jgi:apolipoprotein N-acyltransferase